MSSPLEKSPPHAPAFARVEAAVLDSVHGSQEPRTAAFDLGVSWTAGDEARWREAYRRCVSCDAWVPADGSDLCQGCLAF